jgi:hypothetical protein
LNEILVCRNLRQTNAAEDKLETKYFIINRKYLYKLGLIFKEAEDNKNINTYYEF